MSGFSLDFNFLDKMHAEYRFESYRDHECECKIPQDKNTSEDILPRRKNDSRCVKHNQSALTKKIDIIKKYCRLY